MFDCAIDVVVVDTADVNRIRARRRSRGRLPGPPLLFGDQGATSLLAYELDRLAPNGCGSSEIQRRPRPRGVR